jgi:hypothetical protein
MEGDMYVSHGTTTDHVFEAGDRRDRCPGEVSIYAFPVYNGKESNRFSTSITLTTREVESLLMALAVGMHGMDGAAAQAFAARFLAGGED